MSDSLHLGSPSATGDVGRPDGPDRPLAERLRAEQCARWRRGEPVRVEVFLEPYPALAADAGVLLDLIHQEILLRKEGGEEPSLEEYLRRFPQLAPSLRGLFAGDRAHESGPLREVATTTVGTRSAPGDAPCPPADAVLPSIPGYEVLRELGHGGMGVVYWAWQTDLNRMVALKMLLAGAQARGPERARFRTEAEAVARLQHPNIVQIYEVGEHEGRPYIALEYVGGGNLAQKVTGTPQPAHQAAQLVETLARAVHYAHERGVVHRDLTPGNVLLTEDDTPKLTDFGLAKLLVGGGAGVTQTGAVVGTPSYMAPEQAGGRAKEVGPMTDVYALGAILYDLLTGRPPFRAETPLDTLLQVQNDEPVSVTRLQPNVPRDLETICLKCLHKQLPKRYGSARELADDLHRFLAGEPIRARPVGRGERLWRWCRRNPALAGMSAAVFVLLLTAAVAAMAAAIRIATARDEARARARDAEDAQRREAEAHRQAVEKLVRLYVTTGMRLVDEEGDVLGALPWLAEAFRLEPGGEERKAMHRFRLASVLRDCPRLVQAWFHPSGLYSAEYSPDGRRLVIIAHSDGNAQVWNVATGEAVTPPLRHDGVVVYATFSPDGRRVATAGHDGKARVWDAVTGNALLPPLRHAGIVNRVAFSPDGRRVLTASADATARIWDAATGQEVTPSLPHPCQVLYAAFSPDGRRVVTACGKGMALQHSDWGANAMPELASRFLSPESRFGHARVWDADTGKPLTPFLLKDWWDASDQVHHACFSPDGRLVLTVHALQYALIWDAVTGKRAGPTLQHNGFVVYGSFSPDGRRVATASANLVRLLDAAQGQLITPPLKHAGRVTHASFSPDGRQVLTAAEDTTVRIWDAGTGEPVAPPLRPSGEVGHPAFSPDGRQVLTMGGSTVRVWELGPAAPGGQLLRHRGAALHAAFSPDGQWVVTASNDKTARVWDAATGRAVSPPLRHTDEVVHAAFSPDGRRVVTASSDGTAQLWDEVTGERIAPPLRHGSKLTYASFGPDGRRVVTVGTDNAARLWDVATGRSVSLPHTHRVVSASFSPDGARVLTASWDHTAQVWNAATGRPDSRPLKHDESLQHASFSPDGRHVVTACADRTARVWDAATGQPVTGLFQFDEAVLRASFSPDGGRVVTASSDGAARVWDAATGQPRTPPLVHKGRVEEATFSPDGRRVATASGDGTARVWDAATGQPVSVPLRHKYGPLHVAFSPDGRRLLTSGWDWEARLWDLPQDDRSAEDLLLLAQLLSGYRIDETGGLVSVGGEVLKHSWELLRAKCPDDFAPASTPPAGRRGLD
jgi:WD40 repeat protein